MPFTLIFLYENHAAIESYRFCQVWNILQYSFASSIVWLTMISSIERYLFVFHRTFLNNHFLLLRIIPLLWSLFHPLIIQSVLIALAPPCHSSFNYQYFMCQFACYFFVEFWSIFVWNVYAGIPMILIIVSNTILIGRVLKHRKCLQESHMWSKVVKLIVQVVCVALLDLIAWMPLYIAVGVGKSPTKPTFSSARDRFFLEYLVYFPYLVVVFCPFMCLIGLHELHQPLKQFSNNCFNRIKSTLI